MKILVCIKQVPNTNKVEVDPVTGVLKRSGIKGKMNPYDLFALETSLQLKEKYGGQLTALTMGPGQAAETLQEALYMGADDAVLVSDRKLGGADVLATSYTLSQAIAACGTYDLIICGKQTTDGDTAQVGAEIAEWMGLPHAGNVIEVLQADGEAVTVKLNQEHEIVTQRMPLPCLLCTDADVNTPRLPSYKRKKEIGAGTIRTMTLADLKDTDPKHYGLAGSATQVERIFPPEKNDAKQMFTGTSAQLADRLYALLTEHKFVEKGGR